MTRQRTRPEVAAAELGVDADPSPSALAWSVAHAVAIECGRSPDDAMAIASRWATVADMVGEAPPEPEWVQTGHDEFTHRSVMMAMDFNAVEQRIMGTFGLDIPKFPDDVAAIRWGVDDQGKRTATPISMDEFYTAQLEEARTAKPKLPYTANRARTERSIKVLETIRAARCKCGENCRPGYCVNKL